MPLRLRFFKPKRNNIKTVKNEKENKTMTKTIKINGMMCSHCTGRVGEGAKRNRRSKCGSFT